MADTPTMAGVSSLFLGCLDFYNLIKPVYSASEKVLHPDNEFENQKSRLKRWGETCGLLQNGSFTKEIDAEQLQHLERALREHEDLLKDNVNLKERFGLKNGHGGLESERISRGHRVKTRQPRWQVEDEKKFKQLVAILAELNTDLENFSAERSVQISNLGGAFDGRPAIVSWARGRHDVFVRGIDNSIQHTWQEQYDGPWHEFENLGGQAYSNVSAVSWGPGRIDLFIRGAKNCVYHKFWDGAKWCPSVSEWENLGGTILGDISSVSWGENRIDLFIRGTDNGVYRRFWDGSSWQPANEWENLGGTIVSDPKVTSWCLGHLDVFVVGLDNQIFHRYYFEGFEWEPSQGDWEDLGGTVMGEIEPVSWPGRIDLFHRGIDNTVYQTQFEEQWDPSTSIDGALLGNPGAVAGNGKIDLFIGGTDGALWYRHFDGVDWMSWTSYGGHITGSPVPGPRRDIRQVIACCGVDATLRIYSK